MSWVLTAETQRLSVRHMTANPDHKFNCSVKRTLLTRFNKIAIQARAQMAADKEAVGLSRVLRDNCLFCS